MQNEPKNATQQAILDRLNAGEEIFYHPDSIIAGEVIDMRDCGLIDTGQDRDGYNYIRLPQSAEESARLDVLAKRTEEVFAGFRRAE